MESAISGPNQTKHSAPIRNHFHCLSCHVTLLQRHGYTVAGATRPQAFGPIAQRKQCNRHEMFALYKESRLTAQLAKTCIFPGNASNVEKEKSHHFTASILTRIARPGLDVRTTYLPF